jgi:acetolactate synthase I/II/III large subunit
MDQTQRVADAIASIVAGTGTHLVFGHPGGEVVTLIDAFRRAGLQFVLTHHEASAAFAAGGYAELTGKPGVCIATLGPGATNIVTGVASAMLERAAVLAFTGALADGAPDGATHQRLALQDLFRPITKHTAHITGDDPTTVVREAIAIACAERPGPVHMSLAADVAARTYKPTASPAPSAGRPRRRVMEAPVRAARSMIERSRRPVVIAGLTAARTRVEEPLRKFVAALGAPIVVTPKAKGLVAETDPHFLGVIDMAGDRFIVECLEQADLIIAVGCDVVELDRQWTWSAPVIHVDERSNEEGYYRSEIDIVGAIAPVLGALAEGLRGSGWALDVAAKCRAALLDYVRPLQDSLHPWEVIE